MRSSKQVPASQTVSGNAAMRVMQACLPTDLGSSRDDQQFSDVPVEKQAEERRRYPKYSQDACSCCSLMSKVELNHCWDHQYQAAVLAAWQALSLLAFL